MDNGCLLWIFNNIEKYNFSGGSIAIKNSIKSRLLTEETLDMPEIAERMQKNYHELVSLFYNNIYGYRNGYVDKSITSPELDCYFISTNNGMMPIGYLKSISPAESVVLIQEYLERCKYDMISEKNKMLEECGKNIENVLNNCDKIKGPSRVKGILGISLSAVLVIMVLFSLVKINIVKVFANIGNGEVLKEAAQGIPLIGALTSPDNSTAIFVFLLILLALIGLSVVTVIFALKELKLAEEKNITLDILKNYTMYSRTLAEQAEDTDADADDGIREAARKGNNYFVKKNAGSHLAEKFKNKLAIASDFVTKTKTQKSGLHIALLSAVIAAIVLLPTVYLQAIANPINKMVEKNRTIRLEVKEKIENNIEFEAPENTIEPTPEPTEEIIEEESEYLFPSDREYITKDYLKTLSKEEVALIRNEIYARYGYAFKTETYMQYFSQKSWYRPNYGLEQETINSMFSNVERQNKDTIVEYEIEMGWR